MKKVMYLLGFILCFGTTANATKIVGLPNQISAESGKGTVPEETTIYLDENCDFIQPVKILVTNLDLLNGENCGENTLSLPEVGYPDMYLYCEVGGVGVTVPINSFVMESCGGTSSPSVYAFNYTMIVNFSEECYEGGEDFDLNLIVFAQIRMLEGQEWIPYRICDYTAPDDLFSCEYFEEITSSYCNDEVPCNSGVVSSATLAYQYVLCGGSCMGSFPVDSEGGDLGDGEINPDGDGAGTPNLRKQNPNKQISLQELSVEVSPNPFDEKISIYLESVPTEVQLKMYDTSGRLVKSDNDFGVEEGASWELDTSDLPRGMYILQVQNGVESKFIKLVKP